MDADLSGSKCACALQSLLPATILCSVHWEVEQATTVSIPRERAVDTIIRPGPGERTRT